MEFASNLLKLCDATSSAPEGHATRGRRPAAALTSVPAVRTKDACDGRARTPSPQIVRSSRLGWQNTQPASAGMRPAQEPAQAPAPPGCGDLQARLRLHPPSTDHERRVPPAPIPSPPAPPPGLAADVASVGPADSSRRPNRSSAPRSRALHQEWVDSFATSTSSLNGAGHGRHGRDVIATVKGGNGAWDNYPCKHSRVPQAQRHLGRAGEACVLHAERRVHVPPRRCYLIAPQGAGTKLSNLLKESAAIEEENLDGGPPLANEREQCPSARLVPHALTHPTLAQRGRARPLPLPQSYVRGSARSARTNEILSPLKVTSKMPRSCRPGSRR